jgi:protein arginine kinase activator
MKCHNCGKEEVFLRLTSNINGHITEKHLCAECAEKLGYSAQTLNRPELSVEDIISELFGGRPNKRMLSGYGLVLPTFVIPTMGMMVTDAGYNEEASESDMATMASRAAAVPQAASVRTPTERPVIDAEMQKRREINILREQMKKAAASEDYEKAAALRDTIKTLENGEHL